jgi:4-azaleucine resistance transporter AzlC
LTSFLATLILAEMTNLEFKSDAARAIKTTMPVLLGYLAIGFGFGLLAVNKGYPPWFAVAMSLIVYAGAAQYIGIGLFAAGASLAEIAAVTLIVNLRHAAYGLSLIKPYAKNPRARPYLVFSLTDETFALISSLSPADRGNTRFLLMISAFDQFYWVAGTALGALAGAFIPNKVNGLDFALTALFLVLAVEQVLALKKPLPFLLAGISTLIARFAFGERGTIVAGIIIATAALALTAGKGSVDADAR